MLKIYTMDCSWAGSIIVIAESEEEARELMSVEPNYEKTGVIEAYEIVKGFKFCTLGD